jgi:hypothetical protein
LLKREHADHPSHRRKRPKRDCNLEMPFGGMSLKFLGRIHCSFLIAIKADRYLNGVLLNAETDRGTKSDRENNQVRVFSN